MDNITRKLLNEFQRDFPLSPTPYTDMAIQLGVDEEDVLVNLQALIKNGAISRVGPVFHPRRFGVSALVAMVVPSERIVEVAELINSYLAVNHNYQRDHHYNLWFVVVAQTEKRLTEIICEIEQHTELRALVLPMLESYHIDLGFDLQWK